MDYLGIDISKDSLDVHILRTNEHKPFSNNLKGYKALENWLNKRDLCFKDMHLVMEATGVYWEKSAHWLYEQGATLSVVNPASVKYFVKSELRRGKTDKLDAQLLALYVSRMQPRVWQPETKSIQELKLLSREREDLIKERTAEKNRLHAHSKREVISKVVLKLCQARLKMIKAQIAELDKAIKKVLLSDELKAITERLISMPGIALTTAAVLLAETSGMSFNTAKQLTAYAGISPEPNQSGKRNGYSSISKTGNARIRKALYMPALTASSKGHFKIFYDRLLKNNKPPKAAMTAVARKLLVTAFALIDSKQLYNPDYLCKRNLNT
jgi:transposase